MCVKPLPSLSPQSTDETELKVKQLEQEVTKSKQAVEELSAQLSATQGDLEATRRKCKVAEEEAEAIRQRAQIHFGSDVAPYMTEITHLRTMVGRLSKQVQEQKQQIAERDGELKDRDEELKEITSNPAMVRAKDETVAQLRKDNDCLRREIEEANMKMESLKYDKEIAEEVSSDETGKCMLVCM